MIINNKTMILFQNVSLGYGKKLILQDLCFDIAKGDFLGIIGPNGSGKTTLLKAILGLQKPVSGIVKHNSNDIHFGYVVQRQFVDEIFPLTVEEIVDMGRYGLIGPFKRFSKDDREHVGNAMKIAGIADIAAQSYRTLSGGQKQRVLIARAIASEANILILDEPTNDMDIKGEWQIMELIKEIHAEQNVTVVIVSHILHNIINYVDRLAFVKDSRMIIQSVREAMSEHNLSDIFDCAVKVVEIAGKKVVISGK